MNFRLSEADLQRVFYLRTMPPRLSQTIFQPELSNFKHIIRHLRKTHYFMLADKLERYMDRALQRRGTRFKIVYGRVGASGMEPPQYVSSAFPILSQGYFVALLPKRQRKLTFFSQYLLDTNHCFA